MDASVGGEVMNCPKCDEDCLRDEVDVGVGIICGPWGCPGCGWSESEDYDISSGPKMDKNGWAVDQYGGLTPPPKGTKL